MSRFTLRLAAGGSRPLQHDEELAYLAEKAWLTKVNAESAGDSNAGELDRKWQAADEALWDATGEGPYQAALAWGEQHFHLVRESPRTTQAELIGERERNRAAVQR